MEAEQLSYPSPRFTEQGVIGSFMRDFEDLLRQYNATFSVDLNVGTDYSCRPVAKITFQATYDGIDWSESHELPVTLDPN
jgi:hypothetical protein